MACVKLSDRFSVENTGETYYDEIYTVKTANEIEVAESATAGSPAIFAPC